VLISISFVYSASFFVESPKFFYNQGRYDEARESLEKIANFNGVTQYSKDFIFDNEEPIPDE